ncbi:hypothetical protein M8J76_001784 [Diaphorina citri]|nr:hypothetical protein M8J75_010136 [Diaphorina citri]KAI5729361.1 hypothetical protein M8J76_001784 [Diaphorina citri]KAI5735147.1 hypothetical protein M8J77_014830 [Diaphorina citri]
MNRQNFILSRRAQDEDELSMKTADECLKRKGRRGKKNLKTTKKVIPRKRVPGNFSDDTMRTALDCIPGPTDICCKKPVKKKLKCKKKIGKKCAKRKTLPCELKRQMSYICEPCRALCCDELDPCKLILERDLCDHVFKSDTDIHKQGAEFSREPTPLTEDENAGMPSQSPVNGPDMLRKKTEPNDLDLFMNILGSENAGAADNTENEASEEITAKEKLGSLLNKDTKLQKQLERIYCTLKRQRKLICQEDPGCALCCDDCDMRCCQTPCNPWESLMRKFQRSFCTLVKPCCCQPVCPGYVKPCKSLRSVLSHSCVPCSKRCSPVRCKSSCCVRPCIPVKRTVSGKATSKHSVNADELQFKSRMWLLDRNQKLERKLSRLRKQQKCCCCICCDQKEVQSHSSFLLWQFLMESMVTTLIESHPAVKQKDDVCQCRRQLLDFCDF